MTRGGGFSPSPWGANCGLALNCSIVMYPERPRAQLRKSDVGGFIELCPDTPRTRVDLEFHCDRSIFSATDKYHRSGLPETPYVTVRIGYFYQPPERTTCGTIIPDVVRPTFSKRNINCDSCPVDGAGDLPNMVAWRRQCGTK